MIAAIILAGVTVCTVMGCRDAVDQAHLPGEVCKMVWDDTTRLAVMCTGQFKGYDCSYGEPCTAVFSAPEPNCGRAVKRICAKPEMFKQ